MDQSRFDELSRRLAAATDRRAGLKAALGALLGGVGLAAADPDAEAKRRRGKDAGPEADKRRKRKKTCKPACADGQACVKGACVCENGGTACDAACCAIGQRCEGGQCVTDPAPDGCITAGQPCKATGRACCGARVCASGQGGDADVACYVPKTGACQATADCVYGMACRDGRCSPPEPAAGLATPCSLTNVQGCSYPGAVCTSYTGAGAPDGAFCTLPLQRTCTGNPDCTCYKCWYSNAITPAGRRGRASANTLACCHVPGQSCTSDGDCCLGLSCVGGTCGGAMCVPDDAAGCDGTIPCCSPAATCIDGTCNTCGPVTCPNGCCRNGQCQPGTANDACGTGGLACAACGGSTPLCSERVCIAPCTSDANCSSDCLKPRCNTGTGLCVQCTTDSQCAASGGSCVSGTCACAYSPTTPVSAVCPVTAPLCKAAGTCGGCSTSGTTDFTALDNPRGPAVKTATGQLWVAVPGSSPSTDGSVSYRDLANPAQGGSVDMGKDGGFFHFKPQYLAIDAFGNVITTMYIDTGDPSSPHEGSIGYVDTSTSPYTKNSNFITGCYQSNCGQSIRQCATGTTGPFWCVRRPAGIAYQSSGTGAQLAETIWMVGSACMGAFDCSASNGRQKATLFRFTRTGRTLASDSTWTVERLLDDVCDSSGNSSGGQIALGPGGYLYVACPDTNKVQVLDVSDPANVTKVTSFGDLKEPSGLTFNGNDLYVTATLDAVVTKLTVSTSGSVPTATVTCSYCAPTLPVGLAWSGGQLFVSGVQDDLVRRTTPGA